jgi:signal transduction histidine kinase
MNKEPSRPTQAACLEEILSTLRHQLGNSVNALKVTLDVLQENFDHFDDGKRKEYLTRALEILDRQQALVEAMKSYSSITVNEQSPMEFVPFWENFLRIARHRVEKRRVRLIHDPDIAPCLVIGHPMALHRAMTEVFENALEAVEGIMGPVIELKISKGDEGLMILIKDNGCGIEKADLSKIFIPLFTTKRGRKGMGLPIALKLLTQMGGRLDVETLITGGTQAKVWLKTVRDERDEESLQV